MAEIYLALSKQVKRRRYKQFKRCEYGAGSVLFVRDQATRSNNTEMRSTYVCFLLNRACAKLTLYLRKLYGNDFRNAFFLHGYAEKGVRLVHSRLSVRDNDKLRAL